MTKSPITCVKTFGFTIAFGKPFSFLLLLLSKLLLGDEAALHVVGTVEPFVVTIPAPVPPLQLSTSATDVVVNVELLVNDDVVTAVVVGGVIVVVVISEDFESAFDVSSTNGN